MGMRGGGGWSFARGFEGGDVSEKVPHDSPSRDQTVVREHLANERTLLSWIRTGVGLISIGLVVERTGTLVAGPGAKAVSVSASELFGLALAVLGMVTLVIGTAQFLGNRRRISSGDFVPSLAAYLVIVAGSLALAGSFIAYVLLY